MTWLFECKQRVTDTSAESSLHAKLDYLVHTVFGSLGRKLGEGDAVNLTRCASCDPRH